MKKVRTTKKKKAKNSTAPYPIPDYNTPGLTRSQLLGILQETIIDLRKDCNDPNKRARSTPDVLLRSINLYWTLKFTNEEDTEEDKEDIDRGMKLIKPDKKQWNRLIEELHAKDMAKATSGDKHTS